MDATNICGDRYPAYKTSRGKMYQGDAEDMLRRYPIARFKGKVQLILTSPPFPLNRKKRYGNLTGNHYLEWIRRLGPLLGDYLAPDGSIVIEMGNAWEKGSPTMSTLPMRALLGFLESANLHLCQEFVCYNPARLPTPAQWVTIERIRVKDAFTRVRWTSHPLHVNDANTLWSDLHYPPLNLLPSARQSRSDQAQSE